MQRHLAYGTRVLEALGLVIRVNVEIPNVLTLSDVPNQRLADLLQSRSREREKPWHPPPCTLFRTSQTKQQLRIFLGVRKAPIARLLFRSDFDACRRVCDHTMVPNCPAEKPVGG